MGDVAEVECICGAMIHEEMDDVWVDNSGGTNCYPDSPNPVDAAAKHEPLDP